MKSRKIVTLICSIALSNSYAIGADSSKRQNDSVYCSSCEATKEKKNQCPSILPEMIANDKGGRLLGVVKSKYQECTKDIMSMNADYFKRETLKKEVETHLSGKVSKAIINNINKCPSKETPDTREEIGKAAYSLLRLEAGQKALLNEIAFKDFVLDDPILKDEECTNIIFQSLENQCNKLKDSCFSNKSKERNDFLTLNEKVGKEISKIEKELESKSLSAETKKTKSGALKVFKAQYPWFFGDEYKKLKKDIASGKKSIYEATKAQFKADKKASKKLLQDLQNASDCFYDTSSSFCTPQKVLSNIEKTPELELEVINGDTAEEKNNQVFWNNNMRAQSCLARNTDADNRGNELIAEAGQIAVLTVATWGLGEIPALLRAANATRSASLATGTAFAAQVSVDSYYALSGLETAINACNGYDVQKMKSQSNSKTFTCPLEKNANEVSYSEKESCKFEVIAALAGGVPVAIAAKQALQVVKDPHIKKALTAISDKTKSSLSAAGEWLGSTQQMERARDLTQTCKHLPSLCEDLNSGRKIHKVGTLGAGEGIAAEDLAKMGYDVTAVEIAGKAETLTKATDKGGKITRINGEDAARTTKLQKGTYDAFFDTHGANAYTDRPDLVTQQIVDALKKDGKYHLFGGGGADNWALNNKIILEDGRVVSYIDWLKTIPGIKVETEFAKGGLNEAGELITSPIQGSRIVITKADPNVKIPELENLFREKISSSDTHIVPHQTFKVKASGAKKVEYPKTTGGEQHFVSNGSPLKQLQQLKPGSKVTIAGGPSGNGVLASTKIRLKNGSEVSLEQYLNNIPGVSVTYGPSMTVKRFVEKRDGVKIFTGNSDQIVNNFSVKEQVQVRDMIISVSDPKKLEGFLKEHNLDLIGLGKPAPIKYDNNGKVLEQVQPPYFMEK